MADWRSNASMKKPADVAGFCFSASRYSKP
jgi:hypothetical protein